MQPMKKMKLNYCDWSDQVWYVMKTKQDNDMIDCIGAVYNGNDIEQLEPIRPDVIFDENQTR